MLSESIYHETRFLLHSFLLGILITFIYDNIRVLRRVFRHNTFWVSIEDLFFWIGVALSIFLLQHEENEGVFRWFSVAGAFGGMLICRASISRFYIDKMTVLLRKVFRLLYIFFSYLLSPIYYMEKKLAELSKKLAGYAHAQAMKQKIRLTSKRKMFRMTLCKQKKRASCIERRNHEQKDQRSKEKTKRI